MNRTKVSKQHGYVLMIVLVLLIVLTTAGVYGLRTVEGDIRASANMVKGETLAQAAEAGAGHRMSEIALADVDARAAQDSTLEQGGWQPWPAAGTFPASTMDQYAMYQTVSAPIATVDTRPPAGRQIGSGGQTTVWQIDSYATRTRGDLVGGTVAETGAEYRVSVGVSLWSRGGTSYNTN